VFLHDRSLNGFSRTSVRDLASKFYPAVDSFLTFWMSLWRAEASEGRRELGRCLPAELRVRGRAHVVGRQIFSIALACDSDENSVSLEAHRAGVR
jgi:hypothetical protein